MAFPGFDTLQNFSLIPGRRQRSSLETNVRAPLGIPDVEGGAQGQFGAAAGDPNQESSFSRMFSPTPERSRGFAPPTPPGFPSSDRNAGRGLPPPVFGSTLPQMKPPAPPGTLPRGAPGAPAPVAGGGLGAGFDQLMQIPQIAQFFNTNPQVLQFLRSMMGMFGGQGGGGGQGNTPPPRAEGPLSPPGWIPGQMSWDPSQNQWNSPAQLLPGGIPPGFGQPTAPGVSNPPSVFSPAPGGQYYGQPGSDNLQFIPTPAPNPTDPGVNPYGRTAQSWAAPQAYGVTPVQSQYNTNYGNWQPWNGPNPYAAPPGTDPNMVMNWIA